MEKILDLSKITEFFIDEEEEIKEILLLLSMSIADFLEKTDKCIKENDVENFKFTLHKFKSSGQLVTTPVFLKHIKAIENYPSQEFNSLHPLIDQLKAITLQLDNEIHHYLQLNQH